MKIENPKFCSECVHHLLAVPGGSHVCGRSHRRDVSKDEINWLVTGNNSIPKPANAYLCTTERQGESETDCGVNGRFFEPKV